MVWSGAHKILPIASLLLATSPLSAQNQATRLYGWTSLPTSITADLAFAAGDAFFGRSVCPPLTRLDLRRGKNHSLLLANISAKAGDKGRFVWTLQMRPEMRWWSGDKISPADLVKYVETFLSQEVRRQSLGQWSIPPFSAQIVDTQTVKIIWDSKPDFGPFIFSSWPMLREVSHKKFATSYECAGDYIAESGSSAESTRYIRVAHSVSKRAPKIIELRREKAPASGSTWLDLRFPVATNHPSARPSDRPASCATKIDAPLLSLISWNPGRANTSSASLRQLYTSLTPRGELLRAGAAYLGELVSGPIPRPHPGYNRGILVRAFDIEKTAADLEKSGYKRPDANRWRLAPDGKPLTLRLLTQSQTPGLVEKVVADAFAAVGVETTFTAEDKEFPNVDGVIAGVRVAWPSMNFLPVLHSKAVAAQPFWPLADQELDRLLSGYAASLTHESPNFDLLRKIHARLFAIEPFTLLVQHKLCMHTSADLKNRLKGAALNDPDWLAKILDIGA